MEGQQSVAIVHDWLTGMRGGEKVLEVLCELYPNAVLHTLVHRPGTCSSSIERMEIRTSILQHLPFGRKKYQYYLPVYPFLTQTIDLRGFDLVLSSSHAVAKNVRVDGRATHICYCHTPMRYLWDQYDQYFGRGRAPAPMRFLMSMLREPLRRWDVSGARAVDHFIANSEFVRERIRRIYGCDAAVLHPPVDAGRYAIAPAGGDYYLVVSALVPYKRIDIAVEAFNRLGEKLVIVGSGGEGKRLQRKARGNITFAGWVPDEELGAWYRGCRALLFPGEEDFGIVPVEAMACGKPVIALGRGGVTETVQDGITGLFFNDQTAESLMDAVDRFQRMSFDAEKIRASVLRYDRPAFKDRLAAILAGMTQSVSTGVRPGCES